MPARPSIAASGELLGALAEVNCRCPSARPLSVFRSSSFVVANVTGMGAEVELKCSQAHKRN